MNWEFIYTRARHWLCDVLTGHADSVTSWDRGWPVQARILICKRCGFKRSLKA